MTKIYNENGRLIEIQENGESIYTEEETVRRPKISQKSKESIAEDINAGNLKSALNSLLEVVSGETKEEILGGDS